MAKIFFQFFVVLIQFLFMTGFGHAENTANSSGSVATAEQRQCAATQERFRGFLLQQVGDVKKSLESSLDCYSGRTLSAQANKMCVERKDAIYNTAVEARRVTRKLRTGLARDFLSHYPSQDMVDACVVRDANGDPKLGPNSRILEVKDAAICQPLATQYSNEISGLEVRALDNSVSGNLTASEKAMVLEFRASGLATELSERIKSDDRVSRSEFDKEAYKAFSELQNQSTQLQKHIKDLPAHELYTLYAFGSQYKKFAGELNSQDRVAALSCMKNDGIFRDCFGRGDLKSCLSKGVDFLKSIAPIVSVVDAYQGLQLNQAALTAGLKTDSEYAATAAGLTVQGVAGAFITTSLMKALVPKRLITAGAEAIGASEVSATNSAVATVSREAVVVDNSTGRSAYYVLREDANYVADVGPKFGHTQAPRLDYPLLVQQSDLDALNAISSGAPVKAEGFGKATVDVLKGEVKSWGEQGQKRLATANNGPELKLGSETLKVAYDGNKTVRLVKPEDFTPSPGLESNGLTGAERIKIAGAKDLRFEAIDKPTTKWNGDGTTVERMPEESINGSQVRILVGDKIVSGKYISAGGRDLPRGASPNHFRSRDVEVHFVQVGDEIVAIPAKDARVFVAR